MSVIISGNMSVIISGIMLGNMSVIMSSNVSDIDNYQFFHISADGERGSANLTIGVIQCYGLNPLAGG